MRHTIHIKGHVPSKKNNWKPRKGGGQYCSKADDMGPLLLQVRAQWKRDPLPSATVKAVFVVRDLRGDLDNKYTTLQDLLVKGGVIKNDNIKRIASFSVDAVVGDEESVTVEVLS